MTLTRIFSRGAAGVATALISSAVLVAAAFAQTPPFTVYGSDAGAGATTVTVAPKAGVIVMAVPRVGTELPVVPSPVTT